MFSFKSPWSLETNKYRSPTCFFFQRVNMPHHHKRKHTHTRCLVQREFFEGWERETERMKQHTKKRRKRKKETWISIFFSWFLCLLYDAVGQKLICPIGKFLLHTMQINNSFKLLDRHSYSLLHLSLKYVVLFFLVF